MDRQRRGILGASDGVNRHQTINMEGKAMKKRIENGKDETQV